MCLTFRDMLQKRQCEEAVSSKQAQHKCEIKLTRQKQRAENVAKQQPEKESRKPRKVLQDVVKRAAAAEKTSRKILHENTKETPQNKTMQRSEMNELSPAAAGWITLGECAANVSNQTIFCIFTYFPGICLTVIFSAIVGDT